MSKDFKFIFPENLKKNANLPSTEKLSYSDFGAYEGERFKVKRQAQKNLETKLKVDYSDFSNHVFFNSAQVKFGAAKDRVLSDFPFNGTYEEVDAYIASGSDYQKYIFDNWPSYVGYVHFTGSESYISAFDDDNNLLLGSSSLYVSAWIKPTVEDENIILQNIDTIPPGYASINGYSLYLSGASDPHIKFTLYSGSSTVSVSAAYSDYTASFNSVAAMYDNPADLLYIYINKNQITSSAVTFGPIDYSSTDLLIGSGTKCSVGESFDFYSGSISEVRICHTASNAWHRKNYGRPIYAENYVKLYYPFNEGIIGSSSIDEVVVDYSKSGLHGKYMNYASGDRISGSVMVEDPGNPILYSFHPDVTDFSSSMALSASTYDNDNNNNIFNMIPENVIIEDELSENLLKKFVLSLAGYFDDIKLYIDQFDNLHITNYEDQNEVPDLFLPFLTKYFGWQISNHFSDATPLEGLFGENIISSASLDVSLLDIRNQFWRRTLNNLPYLLQSKGKRQSIDAYLNILGVNKENIILKEYGYLPGGSIQDTRIHKQKVVPFLGIGTGSFGVVSSSYAKSVDLITSAISSYTVESLVQLPYVSASYSGSLLTGSIWQLVDKEQVTGSVTFLWNRDTLTSDQAKFILTSSDGQEFSSSLMTVCDGNFYYIASGLDGSKKPFIEARCIDIDEISFSASYGGSIVFSGVFTGSNFDFVVGANSGATWHTHETQGYFGEIRYWDRILSASEIDDHALHFQSVGINDPREKPHPLRAHWALDEFVSVTPQGTITKIEDLSRNERFMTGSGFPASENPYQKFVLDYSYLSTDIDLKWSENKIRIRNKNELTIDDIATDTNEVSLEFNFVETLNEDITKIFSTFDIINNVIGNPVCKYRDEYSDLEGLRRVYFDRLSDSINFTRFFNLFRWFDKKLSDSIKQLLPARVRFIGGEQVIENHFLERSRYAYKYPVFRTPPDVPEVSLSASAEIDACKNTSLPLTSPATIKGTKSTTERENQYVEKLNIMPRECSMWIDADKTSPNMVTKFSDGEEIVDKLRHEFYRIKTHGDTAQDIYDSGVGVNYKNEYAKKTSMEEDRDNTLVYVNDELGNGFLINSTNSTIDQEHYFSGAKKFAKMKILGKSGSTGASSFTLTGHTTASLWQELRDSSDAVIDTGSFIQKAYGIDPDTVQEKYCPYVTFQVSGVNTAFDSSDISVNFRDENSTAWNTFKDLYDFGSYFEQGNNYYEFRSCLISGSLVQNPKLEFLSGNIMFEVYLNDIAKEYHFRNFELNFCQSVTDDGTKEYRQIDNQNIEFVNLNVNVMSDVEK